MNFLKSYPQVINNDKNLRKTKKNKDKNILRRRFKDKKKVNIKKKDKKLKIFRLKIKTWVRAPSAPAVFLRIKCSLCLCVVLLLSLHCSRRCCSRCLCLLLFFARRFYFKIITSFFDLGSF